MRLLCNISGSGGNQAAGSWLDLIAKLSHCSTTQLKHIVEHCQPDVSDIIKLCKEMLPEGYQIIAPTPVPDPASDPVSGSTPGSVSNSISGGVSTDVGQANAPQKSIQSQKSKSKLTAEQRMQHGRLISLFPEFGIAQTTQRQGVARADQVKKIAKKLAIGYPRHISREDLVAQVLAVYDVQNQQTRNSDTTSDTEEDEPLSPENNEPPLHSQPMDTQTTNIDDESSSDNDYDSNTNYNLNYQDLARLTTVQLRNFIHKQFPALKETAGSSKGQIIRRIRRYHSNLCSSHREALKHLTYANGTGKPPPQQFHAMTFNYIDRVDLLLSFIECKHLRYSEPYPYLLVYLLRLVLVQCHSTLCENLWSYTQFHRDKDERARIYAVEIHTIRKYHEDIVKQFYEDEKGAKEAFFQVYPGGFNFDDHLPRPPPSNFRPNNCPPQKHRNTERLGSDRHSL